MFPRARQLLVGTETRDDAAVFRLDAKRALVATVDFFAPVVDDPRDYGAIAAANALSDVYAMGGRPLYALNIVGFPRGQRWELLTEILAGGAENEGSFEDGAHVQELINAVERSFRERRWVSIPLDGEP